MYVFGELRTDHEASVGILNKHCKYVYLTCSVGRFILLVEKLSSHMFFMELTLIFLSDRGLVWRLGVVVIISV